MTGTVYEDPKWCLERRESYGYLVWKKQSPRSKVRFRFDVEVLEFEKDPIEYEESSSDGFSVNKFTSTIVICVTCAAALAASLILPWYLMGSGTT